MQYLVTMETIDAAMPSSPDQIIPFMENMVIPNHEALTKLQAEKKILAGGCLVGKRANVFIAEAASNEELHQLLMSLPMFAMLETEVTPLTSVEDCCSQIHQNLERRKTVPR